MLHPLNKISQLIYVHHSLLSDNEVDNTFEILTLYPVQPLQVNTNEHSKNPCVKTPIVSETNKYCMKEVYR